MEENKKQESTTQKGLEFLLEQGYKSISEKTFISDLELEPFLSKDFSKINKTRALGFIQILEREYPVDLTELRTAYLEYERSHTKQEEHVDSLFVETPMKNSFDLKQYLPYILGAIFAIGLGVLFVTYNADEKIDPIVMQIEENKSVIQEAKENIAKIDANSTTLETENTSLPSTASAPEVNTTIQNSSAANEDDLDLDKVVLEMMKERNISVEEGNDTVKAVETNTTQSVSEIKEDTKELEAPVVETHKTVPAPITPPSKEALERELYIEPTRKAWVGIIYLDTMQKKDYLIRTKLPLEATRDQLIMVGHKHFKIYNKKYSVNFTGKGPVRFIYRDGELMEISKKEFDKTSAGAGW